MGSLRANYKGVKNEIFNIISNKCLHSFMYLHIQKVTIYSKGYKRNNQNQNITYKQKGKLEYMN